MRAPFRKTSKPRSGSQPIAAGMALILALVHTPYAGGGQAADARKPVANSAATPAHVPAHVLGGIKNWAYQLQNADPQAIARTPYDLVVVDYTRNGDPDLPLKAADVQRMKKKPDGGRRLVLAYVSIGEAEDYRFYWNEGWVETATPATADAAAAAQPAQGGAPVAAPSLAPSAGAAAKPDRWVSPKAPSWLGDESATWSGNFAVKYWDKSWQDLIFGKPDSFVERVLALGFDGVYLDRVDAYYEHIDEHPSAAEDMADFVVRLAAAARTAKPGALVVPQNGEELLTRPTYVAAIDAIAKEDLLFGSPTEGQPNSQAQIANSLGWLSHASVAGRPVMVVEYVDQPQQIEAAQVDLQQRGFIPYFGPRALDRMTAPAMKPAGAPPAAVRTSRPPVAAR